MLVPPMVSTAAGALVIPHLPAGRWRLTVVRGCRPMSGLGLIVGVIVIAAIWQRLCGYPEDADGSRNHGGLSEPRRRHCAGCQ
jgi:hypothetical protein